MTGVDKDNLAVPLFQANESIMIDNMIWNRVNTPSTDPHVIFANGLCHGLLEGHALAEKTLKSRSSKPPLTWGIKNPHSMFYLSAL